MGSRETPLRPGLPAGSGSDPPHELHQDPLDLVAIEAPAWWRSLTDGWSADARVRSLGLAVAAVVAASLAWVVLRPDPPRAEDVVPLAAPLSTVPGQVEGPAVPAGIGASDAPGSPDDPAGSAPAGPAGEPAGAQQRLVVHAAGAVVHPGVYELEPGARVADLVAAAGGGDDEADLDRLNLAEPLVDGSRVYVPAVGEEVSEGLVAVPPGGGPGAGGGSGVGGGGGESAGAGVPLDLNRATADELELLPGIGPTLAASIVDHRTSQGPFASVDDLLAVRGIGDAKLAAVRELVTVGQP